MLKNFATSPDEFRTDLPNARSIRTRNIAEVLAANAPAGVVKLRMIEDVEEFTPNLEVHSFISGIILVMPKSVLLIPGPWKNRRFAVPKDPQSVPSKTPVDDRPQAVAVNALWSK